MAVVGQLGSWEAARAQAAPIALMEAQQIRKMVRMGPEVATVVPVAMVVLVEVVPVARLLAYC